MIQQVVKVVAIKDGKMVSVFANAYNQVDKKWEVTYKIGERAFPQVSDTKLFAYSLTDQPYEYHSNLTKYDKKIYLAEAEVVGRIEDLCMFEQFWLTWWSRWSTKTIYPNFGEFLLCDWIELKRELTNEEIIE